MKSIWDADKDLSAKELGEILRERFGKDYAVTTIRTFLLKLSDKGFIRNYRVKKNVFIRPSRTKEDYLAWLFKREVDFWYNGDACAMICAMIRALPDLTEEDREKIRRTLDALD